jgi:hypothetical protein
MWHLAMNNRFSFHPSGFIFSAVTEEEQDNLKWTVMGEVLQIFDFLVDNFFPHFSLRLFASIGTRLDEGKYDLNRICL